MIRKWLLGLAVAVFAAGTPAFAGGVQFRWQAGQVLNYKVEQTTAVTDNAEGKKLETATKLTNVKHWQVLEVDAAGTATLQMSLLALRIENKTPSGETIVFDSTKPAESDPQMREQLGKYVGQPLVVIRVDARGRMVEVKKCEVGSPSRFEAEPPFVLTLPETDLQVGQSWERSYRITLDPPQGTGEKYEALQKYECRGVQDGTATIALGSMVKNPPASAGDAIPLLQMQPSGGAVFNIQAGRMERAYLRIDKEVKGHQGEGSSYKFQSTYSEEYAGDR